MVYKKYIYKNGKRYGPYIYHSKRIGGKVVSEYHGSGGGSSGFNFNKKFLGIFLGVAILLALVYVVGNFNGLTGKVSLGLEGSYTDTESLEGIIKLSLKEGEFIPASTKVVFTNNGETYEYELEALATEEVAEGDFYVEGKSISGEGLGYGVEGEKEIPKTIYFTLEIIEVEEEIETGEIVERGGEEVVEEEEVFEEVESEEVVEENTENIEEGETTTESEGETTEIVSEEIIVEDEATVDEEAIEETEINKEEIKKEKKAEKTEEKKEKKPEETSGEDSSSESPEESSSENSEGGAPVTGAFVKTITGFFSKVFLSLTGQVTQEELAQGEINGEVSSVNDFEYELGEDYVAQIKSGSVRIKETNDEGVVEFVEISEGNLDLEVNEGVILVTTDYSETESGFGEDYLGDEGKILAIDLSQLNLTFKPGELIINLVYGGEEILSLEANLEEGEISIEEFTEENLTLGDKIKLRNVFLTEEEKAILLEEFGNETSVKTTAIEHSGGVEVKFEFGGKSATRFYDLQLGDLKLESWMQRDIVNWLKDLANGLIAENVGDNEITDLNKEFGLFDFETREGGTNDALVINSEEENNESVVGDSETIVGEESSIPATNEEPVEEGVDEEATEEPVVEESEKEKKEKKNKE